MTDDKSEFHDSAVPITVEAGYSYANSDKTISKQWIVENLSPRRAKKLIVSTKVPLQATLWCVGLWYGHPDARPDGGHKSGILKSDNEHED